MNVDITVDFGWRIEYIIIYIYFLGAVCLFLPVALPISPAMLPTKNTNNYIQMVTSIKKKKYAKKLFFKIYCCDNNSKSLK